MSLLISPYIKLQANSPVLEFTLHGKKIYADLGDKLIMTYISIDDEKGESKWLQLLKEHEILWRSLFTREKVGEIRDLYSVGVIPNVILIHPNGKMEHIDVREEEQLAKLYRLFQ